MAEKTVFRFGELLPSILAAGWVVVAQNGANRLFEREKKRVLLPFADGYALKAHELEWLVHRLGLR